MLGTKKPTGMSVISTLLMKLSLFSQYFSSQLLTVLSKPVAVVSLSFRAVSSENSTYPRKNK